MSYEFDMQITYPTFSAISAMALQVSSFSSIYAFSTVYLYGHMTCHMTNYDIIPLNILIIF